MSNEKREQVYDVLLTPIICEKNEKEIRFRNGVIFSPQDYYGTPDEDMCRFAVDFYDILYKSIIPEGGVLKNAYLRNKEFAGDTMHSFKSVANLLIKAIYNDKLNMEIPGMPYLEYYKVHYHCLANFWIIPMRHGRSSPKRIKDGHETYDFSEFYIQDVGKNWKSLKEDSEITYVTRNSEQKYENYFNKFDSINSFCNTHFINNPRPADEYKSEDYKDEPEELLDLALKSIRERARSIAFDTESDIPNELWDCFNDLGLIKSIFE